MAALKLTDFAGILTAIEKIPGITIEDKSTSRTKKLFLKADDRMALASQVNSFLDEKKVRYVSKVVAGSTFPSTVVVIDGDIVEGLKVNL